MNQNAIDSDGPYTIRSTKAQRTYADLTLDEAIVEALLHNGNHEPAGGTQIVNARGEVVYSTETE